MKTLSLLTIANENNAYIMESPDGDFAICHRHYDENGIEQVRYAPDPCDYRAEAEWRNATDKQIQEWLC